MKAIQVTKAYQIDIIDVAEPVLQEDNQVKIKVKAAGICGSDQHIYHGTNPLATYPRILGHEFSGEVVEIGKSVTKVKVGDRVCVEPIVFCNECYPCKLNRPNICESLEVCGVHRDGGMQEYFLTTEEKCYILPEDCSFERGALVEPFTIAAQANYRGQTCKEDTLLILGAGTIGLCNLMYAKRIGATCIVADIFDDKLKRALEYGADYVINTKNENLDEALGRILDGKGPSLTIDSACTVQTFEDAIRVTRAGGRVVPLGFAQAPSAIAQMHFVKKELSVHGSRLQTHKFQTVVDMFKDGFHPEKLISHRFHFMDIKKAFEAFDNPNEDTVKIMLHFE